jgi:hypothetical protein
MEYYARAGGDLRAISLRRIALRHAEFARVHKQEMKIRMALAGVKKK